MVLNIKKVHEYIGSSSIGACICLLLVMCNVSLNAIVSLNDESALDKFTVHGTETAYMMGSFERKAKISLDKLDGRVDGVSMVPGRGMVWQVPTVFSSWSIGDSYIHSYLEQTENVRVSTSSCIFHGVDQRTITNELMSVKYFMGKDDTGWCCPYGYEPIENEVGEQSSIYENLYALPWGYTYDSYVLSSEIGELNGLEKEEAMLQNIVLEEDAKGISKGTIESSIQVIPYAISEMKHVEWKDGILRAEEANATMTLEFQLPKQTESYLRLQGFDINGSGQTEFRLMVSCGDINKTALVTSEEYQWYFGRENYLFNLGYRDEKETKCTITFPNAGTYKLADIQMFSLPVSEYPAQVERIRLEPLENIRFETNKISGTVSLSSDKVLCMSIPYSEGWSAKVDGKNTEIVRGNLMFMALPLTEGSHVVEFTYCTPGLKLGLLISVVCFGIMLILMWRMKDEESIHRRLML